MFKGRIISRSNINGKVHTFQKDFDDYDAYQAFMSENPEYSLSRLADAWYNPWSLWDRMMIPSQFERSSLQNAGYLPEGIDLGKYQKRLQEQEAAQAEKAQKKQALEDTRTWLTEYLQKNPQDTEAQSDLKKVEESLAELA